MRTLIIAMMLIIWISTANAAVFHVQNGGEKSSGASTADNWTAANCYPTIQAAIAQMSASDSIIIDDGTYTGANNTMINGTNLTPPSGSEGAYTTVKARNYGAVILDGEATRKLVSLNAKNYLHFDGIIFKNAGGGNGGELFFAAGANSSNYANHLKITRCGFSEVPDTTGGSGYRWNLFNLRYYEYFLVEDCYAWGNGKYRFYILDCRNGILRRTVDRIDRSTDNDSGTYGNIASIRLYNSNNIIVQNPILIDSDQSNQYLDPVSTSTAGHPAMFFSDGTDNPGLASNNQVIGAIGVNNTGAKVWLHGSDIDYNTDSISNSAFWGFAEGIRTRENAPPDQMTITKSVFGNIAGSYAALYTESGYGIRARYSIFTGDITAIKSTVADTAISDYNSFFNNTTNFASAATIGQHDITNINPLADSLLYLLRIENGSPLAHQSIGPTIMYQVGVTGTIYGETGYDTVTNTELWPFPYEATIRTAMRSYSVTNSDGTIDGTRGFCADGETLTNYIWEYLGNEIPADPYADWINDYDPPITSSSPAAGRYATAQTVTLTANETATIKYSLNGSAPSLTYSAPIKVYPGTTLKYYSTDTAGNVEAIHSDYYGFPLKCN